MSSGPSLRHAVPLSDASRAGRGARVPAHQIRRILLIQPPAFSNKARTDMTPNVPLGIAYIAAALEREGYDVRMLDAFIEGWDLETPVSKDKMIVGMPFDSIKEVIAATRPDAIGVTSMFTAQRKNAHRIATLAKQVDSTVPVIFGGAHPTAAPEMVLEDPDVDVVVLGEGDNCIVPVLRTIEAGGDLSLLDGVAFRDAEGRLVVNHKHEQIQDLDELPFPARHLLPMEKYFAAGVRHGGYSLDARATSMITSRGCQYYCNFCTAFKVFTRKPRMRTAANVLAELDELVKRYNITEVFFEDDQFLAHQKRTEEILEGMAARFSLKFDTPNGVSSWILNDRVIGKMKAAGCYRVNLAIESGSQYVLEKIINKPVKVDKIPELAGLIRKHGMEIGTFLVVGNIGRNGVETLDQVRESFRLARRIKVRPHVSFLTPYPGSEVLEVAREKGYLVPNFDFDDLVITKQVIETPEWSRQALRRTVDVETTKTYVWALISQPGRLARRVMLHLRRNPAGLLKTSGRMLKEITRVVLSDENGRQGAAIWLPFSRFSPLKRKSPVTH